MSGYTRELGLENPAELLHPELFNRLAFGGNAAKRAILAAANQPILNPSGDWPVVTVVIRTLNEAGPLAMLLEDVRRQQYPGKIETVVVDNESADGTPDVARKLGARVVTIARDDFTYPRSMNTGLEAAQSDFVFSTVGHALLTNTHVIKTGVGHFISDPQTTGVFSTTVPGHRASLVERFAMAKDVREQLGKGVHRVTLARMGVMSATNAMFSKPAWKRNGGFNEKYELSGEDVHMARIMLENGGHIYSNPALTAHHSHGLNPYHALLQFRAWQKMLNDPERVMTAEERRKLFARRPDIDTRSA